MKAPGKIFGKQPGFSMIEVLVTLVILMLGLLGLVGMMLASQRTEMESYQRAQALILLQDMVGRINTNRTAALCYAITTDTVNGAPYLGVGSNVAPACSLGTVQAYTLANNDLSAWSNLLIGTSEKIGVTSLGAMVGARGCVSLDTATGQYLVVSVAWQGKGATAAPRSGLGCGKGLYGQESQRRVVSAPVQIANLN
ncbi:type IV pilus modification protein PilV [Glaciimonas immobilis]|uniref:Type IV pilus assembly protein PilV n=1 Tax=Glaciimonas immobilis TaxID=728004 RepID=A0A840RMN8_9BURK|nr:type IV pilus modification protein PilV [Glaciimonas immobilis]KAF3997806.1 type IV pilus modification protein PilV [Glaciimonas immobilis]MBB5199567.1 type IV pilus assembly protein PilV [Glaciimonas immobilis]